MNDTAAQIIPVIRENRRKFEAFCYSLSEEELARPVPDSTWIVKDFVAHLGSLDARFDDFVLTLEAGGTASMVRDSRGDAFDLDAWNDAQVAQRRAWPLRRVFEEAAANRERLLDALAGLSEEQVARSFHFSDPKRGSADIPLKAFLVGWAQHDPIHVADMLKAMPERAADAELQAWLAHPFVTGYQSAMSGEKKS